MTQKSASQHVQELRDLVIAYVKQETVDPLKGVGRYVGFGVGAAVFFGLAIVFVAVGVLRLLQGPLEGNSWGSALAYLIVVASLGLGAALYGMAAKKASARATASPIQKKVAS